MKTTINSHGHKITNPKTTTKERISNYIDRAKCPVNQNCLISNIIYKAVLVSNNPHYKKKSSLAQLKLHSSYRKPFKFLK